MDIDYGVIIGLIGAASVAGVLGLSYVGAYMLGHTRGRREAERQLRAAEQSGNADRLLVVEDAVGSVARAVGRLAEAQRLLLIDQQRPHERPGMGAAESRLGMPRPPGTNTPA